MIFDNEKVQNVVRIVIAIAVLIFIISMYNDPPFIEEEEPITKEQTKAPPQLIEREWYPDMTPDIPFKQSNDNTKPW